MFESSRHSDINGAAVGTPTHEVDEGESFLSMVVSSLVLKGALRAVSVPNRCHNVRLRKTCRWDDEDVDEKQMMKMAANVSAKKEEDGFAPSERARASMRPRDWDAAAKAV